MDYTRRTVQLLLERHPEYLEKRLASIGISFDPKTDTADSVTASIARRNHAERKRHTSSIYTCKCGSNNVVTREVQTRSSDEGSTIVYICEKCGNTY